MKKPDMLPILIRSNGLFKINTQILPESCNKPEFINKLYGYVIDKYSFTHGQYKISDINRDLTDLLKREGIL